MKKTYLVCILLSITLLLCACNTEQQPNEQQLQCEHEWVEIDWHLTFDGGLADIYCPKCKLEKSVSLKELNRIEADMNYKNNR